MAKKNRRPGSPSQVHLRSSHAIALIVCAALAMLASFELLVSELEILGDPDASLVCDVNPLIACSSSLLSSQAHLFFGVPNSVIGLVAFAALLTLAVLLAGQVPLPRWVWWGMGIGTALGLVYVGYFLWQSVTVFRALCPYCMVIWATVIGAAVIVWANILAEGLAGSGPATVGQSLRRYGGLVVLLAYLLIVLIILVGLHEQIARLF